MIKSPQNPSDTRLPLSGAALFLWAAVSLGGCIVQERVAAPPPSAYEAPPPPPSDYAEPGVDIEVRATEPPPPLPDYDQPPCPEDGYLWTPGYWAWGGGGYYWVPGTWVQPPRVGVLWTPVTGAFLAGLPISRRLLGAARRILRRRQLWIWIHGVGFVGGRWDGNRYAYNRTVNNVNVTNVHNTYNETVTTMSPSIR